MSNSSDFLYFKVRADYYPPNSTTETPNCLAKLFKHMRAHTHAQKVMVKFSNRKAFYRLVKYVIPIKKKILIMEFKPRKFWFKLRLRPGANLFSFSEFHEMY